MRDRPSEKIRDMSRSVLPSKARKTARIMKSKVHRAERRRAKQMLDYMDDLDGEDFTDADGLFYDNEDDLIDRAGTLQPEIREVVRDRRDADKLGGFIRWANANTKHLETEVEKYFEIRSKIGTGVIKDHALGHFVRLENAQNPTLFKSILDTYEYRKIYPCPWKSRAQLVEWIREAIVLDHAGFNAFLRKETTFRITVTDKPCEDGPCWRDEYTGVVQHDETLCDSKDILQCIANWRKAPTAPDTINYTSEWGVVRSLALPNKPCWPRKMHRVHSDIGCANKRTHVLGAHEADIVADHFWVEKRYNKYANDMFAYEEALANFFKRKGIID